MTLGNSALRPVGLIERLASKLSMSHMRVRDALAACVKEGWIEGVSKVGDPIHNVFWKGPRPSLLTSCSAALHKVLALKRPDLLLSDLEINRLASPMEGLSSEDIELIVDGLIEAAQRPLEDSHFTSARYLLGSAKALRGLARLARVFEVPESSQYTEMYVITCGPERPRSVVLIENVKSFTAFSRSRHVNEVLGLCAYGYGLTMENFGERLQAGHVVACPSAGSISNLRDVLSTCPTLWWGDLDMEGLRIYESLLSALPNLQFSGAYGVMLELSKDPTRSHPYHRLFEKAEQRAPRDLTPMVSQLHAACRSRAVDQEAIGARIDDIEVGDPWLSH